MGLKTEKLNKCSQLESPYFPSQFCGGLGPVQTCLERAWWFSLCCYPNLLLPVHGLLWLQINLWCWLYLKQDNVPKVEFQEIIEDEKVLPRGYAESILINFGNVFLNSYLVFLNKSSTVMRLQRHQSIISQIMATWDMQNNEIDRSCSCFLYWAELNGFYWGKVGP